MGLFISDRGGGGGRRNVVVCQCYQCYPAWWPAWTSAWWPAWQTKLNIIPRVTERYWLLLVVIQK